MRKLTIVAYKDVKYEEELADCLFVAPINPGELSEEVRVLYGDTPWLPVTDSSGKRTEVATETSQEQVTNGNSNVWAKTDRRSFTIMLILDATGAVIVNGAPMKEPVEQQIASLKWALLDGTKPRYVKLIYDSFTWKVRLDKMKISYTLFRPDGQCVRASVGLDFIEELIWSSQLEADADLNKEVKQRMANSSTKIDQVAEAEYNDEFKYLRIAKANKIKYFRSLVPGFVYKIFPKL